MAPSVNLTQLAANSVVPVSGNNYTLQNLAFSHFLDNAGSLTEDGNFVLAWHQNLPTTANQIWKYLTYPSTSGETVFTLEVQSTLESSASIDGRGGYLRVNTTTNKLIQGGQPLAWKLTPVGPTIFKFSPFDDIISSNGELVATDTNSVVVSPAENQVALQPDQNDLTQFWIFN